MEDLPERWWHLGAERRRWNRTKAALGRITTAETVALEEVRLVEFVQTVVIQLLEQAGSVKTEIPERIAS